MESGAEVREYCFHVWRKNNRDFSKAARQIKKEDYCSATRTTISRWCEKYGWVERADSLDLKEQETESQVKQVLDDLVRVHNKIMTYIDAQAIDEVDTAKINSLVNNAKQIADITSKIKKDMLEKLSEEDKEAVQFNMRVL